MPTLEQIVAKETIQYYDCIAINIDATHNYYITQSPYDLELLHNGVTETFKAAGGLLSISEYEDNAQFSIDKLSVSVAGIVPLDPADDPIMVEAQTLEYIDKPVTIYRAFMVDYAVEYRIILFKGYIDAMAVTQNSSGDTTQVNIEITSHWADFDRVTTRYTNNTSQQEYFSGDVGLEYSVEIQKEITWREV